MRGDVITAVQIIHDELQGAEYYFLSEYFRWAGSYVYGYETDADWSKFNVIIVIKPQLEQKTLDELEKKAENNDTDKIIIFLDAMNEDNKEAYLDKCIEQIIGKDDSNSDVCTLKALKELYVQYDLGGLKRTCNWFKEKKEVLQNVQDKLVDIYHDLSQKASNLVKYGEISKYFIYAKNELAYWINKTCFYLRQDLLFDTEKCIKQLDYILKIDPSFTNVYILKGFLASLDLHFKMDCKGYYHVAIDKLEGCPYADYVLWQQGRFYERELHSLEEAKKYYERAVQANHKEYRAYYKIAQIYENKKEHLAAIEQYTIVCNILNNKKKHNYLNEVEYEYLYKSYYLMSTIYKDYLNNEQLANEMLHERDNIYNLVRQASLQIIKNELYHQLYGKDANAYLELTYDKLSTDLLICKY